MIINKMTMTAILFATALASGCADTIRSHIYLPDDGMAADLAWPGATPQVVSATTEDGLKLTGYYWPPATGRTDLIIYFHGNGGNGRAAAIRASALREGGHGVLVADYRGYGGNPGRPNEAGLFADGDAWMKLAQTLQPMGRKYVFGHSLGGAIALEMAGRGPVDGVITLGTFSRLADVAPGIARPFLPDRYDNISAIRRVTAPVFLLHGTADSTVPYANAARLKAASGDRATVITLNGAGHQVNLAEIAAAIWKALEATRR